MTFLQFCCIVLAILSSTLSNEEELPHFDEDYSLHLDISKIQIDGPESITINEEVSYDCVAHSNIEDISLEWKVNSEKYEASELKSHFDEDKELYNVVSNIKFVLEDGEDFANILCFVTDHALDHQVQKSVKIIGEVLRKYLKDFLI